MEKNGARLHGGMRTEANGGARRARGKAKERRDASARAGTGLDTARGGGEQGGAEPKKPARKGRAHRSGLRGRQSGAEIEGEMRREQPRTGAAARRSRGNEPCVAAARKRGMRAEKSGNRRDCPPVRMGGNGRAASVPRAAGERRAKGYGGTARSAAVSKPRRKPPQTSPSGSIASAALQKPAKSRLGRAPREAPPRRHWKNPRGKPASDEPLSDLGKARRKPPRTSPSGSIAAATVRGIVGRAAG